VVASEGGENDDGDDDMPAGHISKRVCCRSYYDRFTEESRTIRMARIFGLVNFVDRDGHKVAE
jgi:hypothetical protein